MAVTAVQISPPSTRRAGRNFFQIDRERPVTIFALTKLAGDTTYSLDTKLEWCRRIDVLDSTGAPVTTATATYGSGAPGTFTSALAVLGAGTIVFVICYGNRATH